MMLQLDGSPHDWLEGRGPRLTLMGAIDDATSRVVGAFFEEQETSHGYLKLFSEIFRKEGLKSLGLYRSPLDLLDGSGTDARGRA